MKKTLSWILSLALLCGTALPAVAADSTADQLTKVTQTVKQTLSIGNEYDLFSGELQEDSIRPSWSLRWDSDHRNLTVTADENGKILRYNLNENNFNPYTSAYSPSFPKCTQEEAQAAAQAFLDKVLVPGERAVFQADKGRQAPSITQYYFNGTLFLNDLPSPYCFSITVEAADRSVTRFSRDDLNNLRITGDIPSAKASIAVGVAGTALKGTLALNLEYVLPENGKKAVLRYLPAQEDEYFVDAQSGQLINLSQLYLTLQENGYRGIEQTMGAAASARPDAVPKANLSAIEQASIEKMKGVLPKEQLDQTARALSGLGLNNYTLSSASYHMDQTTEAVSVQLQYNRPAGEEVWRRTVSLDAKTGTLQSVFGHLSYDEARKNTLTESAAQAKAEAFLTTQWGGQFSKTAQYSKHTEPGWGTYSFTYAQKENGSFFPQNSIEITIDATDGSVCTLSRNFDETVLFDPPQGILSADAALTAWFNTYSVQLGYQAIPQALDPAAPDVMPLWELGYRYLNGLTLSYSLSQKTEASGLDAKTGTPISSASTQTSSLSYTDLEGVPGKAQVEKLASFSIGYPSGRFQPQKELTQIDLLALLASALDYQYNPEEEGAADSLYRYAYERNLITKAQREDNKHMTRAEMVKLLLDGAGYNQIAKLNRIFKCSFTDAATIPDAYLGYAALAQGLELITDEAFAPNRTATRMEAALFLYQFMSR